MTNVCKILTVVGARPQFVKASVVSRALRENGNFRETLAHTGQHFDDRMSDVFFDELSLPEIKYHLGIDSLSHGAMTGRMLEAIEAVIETENPDYVLVFGDTNSTLAAALAAKKLHKKVSHVEAGLRSFDQRMPEEINRVLTDRISDILFCPTERAVENLRREGFENFPAKIVRSGDVMLDAFRFFRKKALEESSGNLPENFVLCTLHRAENTDDAKRLKAVCEALNEIGEKFKVVFPLHPRTKKKLEEHKIDCRAETIEPVGYLEMIRLLERCRLVLTDSGGLQKESFFAGKFCLTLRGATEWTELVESGCNRTIAAIEKNLIVENFYELLRKNADFSEKFYGDGNAAEIIADEIWRDFSENAD